MKYTLIIDPEKPEEEVVVTAHAPSALTQQLEALVRQHASADRVMAYDEDEIRMLPYSQIECVTVLGGKTFAIDTKGKRYRLKQRLYELEAVLPQSFIRINKSALANETRLERFTANYSGAVDAIFKCGYREYVSRRCFAQIKRRFEP